jgi:5-methylcytosine-specific restriction endonuclease McrA
MGTPLIWVALSFPVSLFAPWFAYELVRESASRIRRLYLRGKWKYSTKIVAVEAYREALVPYLEAERREQRDAQERERVEQLAQERHRELERELEIAHEREEQMKKWSGDDLQKELNYKRKNFKIRDKDYKRGNPLDNHFRNKISDQLISTFGGSCLCCDSTEDLALDHFAIPKNEGGNFALYLKGQKSIKLNIAVLCRSCNASKGERDFKSFFTEEQLAKAMYCQRYLLEWVLNDATTMTVIRKWYCE